MGLLLGIEFSGPVTRRPFPAITMDWRAMPMTTTISTSQHITSPYTLAMLCDEAKQLVDSGAVSRQQPIFTLCRYIAAREWPLIEAILEEHDYLLRDRIADLLTHETWEND
jgi:hypothetical protein